MSSSSHGDEARWALAQKIERAVFAQRLQGKNDITLTAKFEHWQEVIAALRADPVRAVEEMREQTDALKEANANLHIAFMVLSESGHGGGMYEVRRWFNSGTEKPIPWPGGALFEAWASGHGIVNRNGAMAFDLPIQPAAEGGAE